jgi:hypothetical protein
MDVTIDPVDDPMREFDAAAVAPPWEGWDPQKSLSMAAALQDADLQRMSRMFVGLPQVGVVTFTVANGVVTAHQELRCPLGGVEPGTASARQVIRTEVQLG